ncbi:hypothetical protein CBS101457_006212 [Exobasidium rhododendri]|nr:hypothetical protein CBS101457_006212 [Exobasidium rhododendri]
MSSASSKLDLSSLQSYSPSWPYPVRLTLAIAVQYACMRCVERADAVQRLLYPVDVQANSQQSRGEDDSDDDLVERDDDGNVKQKLEGWERKQRIKKDGELIVAWREYTQKFVTATCQHLGIPEETLPPGPTTLEDIRAASRGRPDGDEKGIIASQYEMGTSHASPSHEGTGKRAEDIKAAEKVEAIGKEAKGDEERSATLNRRQFDEGEPSARAGGALDDAAFNGKEIELANELLLIALGLGQHRAEDGSTTLFEQEAIFGDLDTTGHQRSSGEGSAAEAYSDIKSQEPMNATSRASEFGTKAWGLAASSIGKARKDVKQRVTSSNPKRKGAPLKPNETCHYDARARAIIFVAVTAMNVKGLQVWMAEKVIAQTIFFILSEGRNESVKQGKGDPLQIDNEAQSARHGWMNTASQDAVAREKSKVNWGRYLATGASVAIGGTLIGLTAGLAAPVVAPALMGLTGFSFLLTTGGSVLIGGLLGVTGGGLAGYKVQKRLRGLDHFEFAEVQSATRKAGMTIPSLQATICCSGLLLKTDKQGAVFEGVFRNTRDARDVYVIKAEELMMQNAGEGLKGYVLDTALQTGGRKIGEEVIKHTALAGLAALALPLTIWGAASAALNSVFVQAKSRSYRAGLILADVLRNETQGHRPVNLIGTSLGCYTILTALGELAKNAEENAHLVDSVILIGAPVTPSPGTLRRARSVTSRRFVNAYTRDMVCSIAAWLGSGISIEELRGGMMPRVVGSQPILGVPGVENVDVGDLLVDGHFALNQPEVLEKVLDRCRALEE